MPRGPEQAPLATPKLRASDCRKTTLSGLKCGTGATHRMGETAAKVLASSAMELVTTPGLLKEAKEEFDERQKQQQIEPLVPLGLEPPINLRWPEWVDRPGSEWWIPS